MALFRQDQQASRPCFPTILADPQLDPTFEDVDRRLVEIDALADLGAIEQADHGLAQDLLMTAEDGVGRAPRPGVAGGLELLAGQGLDRYLRHRSTIAYRRRACKPPHTGWLSGEPSSRSTRHSDRTMNNVPTDWGTPMWTTPHRSIERGLRSGVGGPHGSAVRTGRRSTEHRVHDAAPGALVSPDVLAQSLQLQDLRVVDEEIDLVAVVLEVPLEDGAVGSLEHDVLQADAVDDRGHRGGVPVGDVLGDALGFDHHDVRSRLERAVGALDQVADVLGGLGGQLGLAGVAAGSDLDAELGLGLQAEIGRAHV